MRKLVVTVVIFAIAAALGSPAAGQTAPEGPQPVVVYDFNINKMDKNWTGWVDHVKTQGPLPDLILLQDFENKIERAQFQARLGRELGGTWRGRGSAQGWHAAVVWRAERFEDAKSRTWRGFGDPNHGDGQEQCVSGNHGAPAIQVRLRDKIASRYVSAVSFKTPPKETPETCPWRNAARVNRALREKGWSGGLLFMGTDANSSDWNEERSAWRCWYHGVNGALGTGCGKRANLGYSDPIFDLCGGEWAACIDGTHDTHRNKAHTRGSRIDFLFGARKTGTRPPTAQQATLPWGEPEFSDHRSVRGAFNY